MKALSRADVGVRHQAGIYFSLVNLHPAATLPHHLSESCCMFPASALVHFEIV